MKIQRPDKIFFFTGAAAWIIDAIKYAESKGMECHVFAVSRHLNEKFNEQGTTFKDALTGAGVSWVHCDDINNCKELRSLVGSTSIGVGLGEAYTFSTETLALFNRNVFDFMTIRMPKYRGGAHYTWQILQQSRIGAWYIQMVNEEMIPAGYDSGEIIESYEYIIPASARIPRDYFAIADAEGLKAFKKFINQILDSKEFSLSKLQENFSLYFPRLFTLNHGYINWNWTGEEIERFICAFDEPYAGASTFCNGERIFLKSCQLDKGEGSFHPFMNGLIYRIHNGKAFIAVGNGTIVTEDLTNEKGNSVIDKLKIGYRLYTPLKHLEEAMLFNSEYNSRGLI